MTEKVFECFSFNNLKANTSKCYLFVFLYETVSLNVRGSIIESSDCEKLLEIFDSNFTFECNINRICRKTSQKLHALSRISKYISVDKKRLLFKSFIISQFNYCPIVWMCSKFTGEHHAEVWFQQSCKAITLRYGCSPVNLLHVFRTPFPRNTSGWLLLIDLYYFCEIHHIV